VPSEVGNLRSLSQLWFGWAARLVIVPPETVVRWHCAGFRLDWRFLSRRRGKGRPRISSELGQLIVRMAKENSTPVAERIDRPEYRTSTWVEAPDSISVGDTYGDTQPMNRLLSAPILRDACHSGFVSAITVFLAIFQ
jgi:hypothetical protein